MNYFEHNDQHLQAIRRIAAANHADRARMLATIHERDMGCVTLYMDKWTMRHLLLQAHIIHAHGKVPALGTAMSRLMDRRSIFAD